MPAAPLHHGLAWLGLEPSFGDRAILRGRRGGIVPFEEPSAKYAACATLHDGKTAQTARDNHRRVRGEQPQAPLWGPTRLDPRNAHDHDLHPAHLRLRCGGVRRNPEHHNTQHADATPPRLEARTIFDVSIDEDVDGGIEDTSVLLTLRLNDLPMHLMLIEVTDNGSYCWPEPVDEDFATHVAALDGVWGMTNPPMLLEWQGRWWLATVEPFEQ